MKIIVQKFGGTSISTPQNRKYVLKHIKRKIDNGYKVIVVVSAMGRFGDPYSTDSLVSLLGDIHPSFEKKSMDSLMSYGELISATIFSNELFKANIRNTLIYGDQLGITTDNNYTDARIVNVDTTNILAMLETSHVVVVPGFQGISLEGQVTTLGRGGSDVTACALGNELSCNVHMYKDVSGIYEVDPKLYPKACQVSSIDYDTCSILSKLGSQILHPLAVDYAKKTSIQVRISNTFSDESGTLLCLEKPLSTILMTKMNNMEIDKGDEKGIRSFFIKNKLPFKSIHIVGEIHGASRLNMISIIKTIPFNLEYKKSLNEIIRSFNACAYIEGTNYLSFIFNHNNLENIYSEILSIPRTELAI